MIVRVWRIVNNTQVDFTPIEDRPGYWEGYGPKAAIYQEIEIFAKNDIGKIGRFQTKIVIREWSPTQVRLLITPYKVSIFEWYKTELLQDEEDGPWLKV